MIMGVQRKWMYLESIFVGSEDIRKQLPAESAMFDDVNANWKRTTKERNPNPIPNPNPVPTPNPTPNTTKELFEAGTAYKGAHIPGMLDRLGDMDDKLDRIQKSLDEYLETKRQAFPRFYFLSNDDLLEILGQAREI